MQRNLAAALAMLVAVGVFAASGPADTYVQFDTVLGKFNVRLYNEITPITVANFLNYVDDDDFDRSFFHRLSPDFVLQGGYAKYQYNPDTGQYGYVPVPTDDPIQNEFNISNTRGTVAMAKQGGDPNSATSQFFINLADNSENLDNQNGGFTAFGSVIGLGMNVVDDLASQQHWNATEYFYGDESFSELPLIDYEPGGDKSVEDCLEIIETVTRLTHPTVRGDYDGDGHVTAYDIVLLVSEVNIASDEVFFDLTGDGLVREADRTEMLEEICLPGLVDGWHASSGTPFADGDLTGDGTTDAADLSLLPMYKYLGVAAATGQAVPEPASVLLLAGGAAVLLAPRRRGA